MNFSALEGLIGSNVNDVLKLVKLFKPTGALNEKSFGMIDEKVIVFVLTLVKSLPCFGQSSVVVFSLSTISSVVVVVVSVGGTCWYLVVILV